MVFLLRRLPAQACHRDLLEHSSMNCPLCLKCILNDAQKANMWRYLDDQVRWTSFGSAVVTVIEADGTYSLPKQQSLLDAASGPTSAALLPSSSALDSFTLRVPCVWMCTSLVCADGHTV